KSGAMEVTSKFDFFLYIVMSIPLYAALALLAWKLSPAGVSLLSATVANVIYGGLLLLFAYQVYHILQVNKGIFEKPIPAINQYIFKQLYVLNLSYLSTFGSELAVLSMLLLFLSHTFNISAVQASLLSSCFAFMILVSQPTCGYSRDTLRRKRSFTV